MSAPLHADQRARGASEVLVAGASVALHFGDAVAEYRAVREAVGVADRADLAQIRMWGKDPVRMLQGLITNDLAGASPGRGVYGAMLTAKGRMIAELRAFPRTRPDADVLISLPREALAGSSEHLKKFVPPMFARWSDVSAEVRAIGVYGPRSPDAVRALLEVQPPVEEDATVEASYAGRPVLVAATRYAGGEPGYDVFLPAEAADGFWAEAAEVVAGLGGRAVGYQALETLRIEAGRPRYGAELTEDIIPTEAFESTGLLPRAISFTKGCYTGQEVIVRIAHRGHVNRHLRGVLLGDQPLPAAGTRLHHPDSGKDVGWVTSATHSPLSRQGVALGFIRRELGPGDPVRVGSADAPIAPISALPFVAMDDGAGA